MADIAVTAANVATVADADNLLEYGTAGATITAGHALYLDSATGKYKLCDNDSATAAVRELYAVALNGASDGQPLRVQRAGTINLGATLAVGTIYTSSATAGGIAPAADLSTGEYTSILGVALTAANLKLKIYNSGVAWP